ncbi:PiggyBac transposable element-derived protein 4 [Blattella germanica]|nr:PiggyBac transposable element-derived protein 4 [Blattella germanica]PSN33509.1 PiggyBac transposable element-derived protein 4 [Blattella germanica]
MVCESDSGYICTLKMYDAGDISLRDTIFELLDPYLGHGYTVYLNNFYNSVALAKELLERNTIFCGPIRQNREVPRDFREQIEGLEREEMTFIRDDQVLLLTWMDKKPITMISTMHSAEMVEVPRKFGKTKMKPECIVDYNQHMHRVDNADQHFLSIYPFVRRTVKWPTKVFFYILQCTLCNAFRLHQKNNRNKSLPIFIFMQMVSRNFIQDSGIIDAPSPSPSEASTSSQMSSFYAPPPKRAPFKDPPFRLDGKRREHILAKFPPLKNSKSTPSRKCKVCHRNKIRSETRWYCIKCGVPLHPGTCDTKYHTLNDY